MVAFFDILGTTSMVKQGAFTDLHALDFANPAGIMARSNPRMRFAAFSDSVVVSADESMADEFLSVLSFLYTQWWSDAILARGGVVLGEIHWVGTGVDQSFFRFVPNFAYARVYGQALVDAIGLERSGPG
ncbi:MAG: hypothetical protein M3P51_11680, partial [Chloroflexota bacterium]|nr:hypothetical protein [Chloroflexota bacterium]